ncbi:Uncharacterised protein [Mycobacteroides abscessus subsp. abscessus]|nr:Uncharacterised protein [Mycobacteroides abscessus subsp. abscessus]
MAVVKRLGNRQTQNGIPEELQPFVGGQATVLVGIAAMRERKREQLIAELYTDRRAQVVVTMFGGGTHWSSPKLASLAQRGSILS